MPFRESCEIAPLKTLDELFLLYVFLANSERKDAITNYQMTNTPYHIEKLWQERLLLNLEPQITFLIVVSV